MSLESQLHDLAADIQALEAEVRGLNSQHGQLYREVSLFEAENKYKNLSKPAFTVSPPEAPNDGDDTPALIHYSYFDPSISKYFPKVAAEKAADNSRVLETIQLKTTAGHVALTESIWRFGGITAFPINQQLYRRDEDSLLGLRFDVLSAGSGTFLTAHYIILRRYVSNHKDGSESSPWRVFRYTTPAYVPLDRYSEMLETPEESEGLQRFVEAVRSRLMHVQWKHELFDRIQAAVGVAVSRDLGCRRVAIEFSGFRVELLCTDSQVESCTCNLPDRHAVTVQAMVGAMELVALEEAVAQVVAYVQEHKLDPPAAGAAERPV